MCMIHKFFNRFLLLFALFFFQSCENKSPDSLQISTLHISAEGDPHTLSPRQACDFATATVMHALYEGLMRLDEEGSPIFALAEDYKLSEDQKTYTFTLRKSAWSSGEPVTAYDFEQTWKSILDPKFP